MAPKLKLVDNAGGSPRPLGPAGMALWRSITRDYDISDAAGIELLCLACQSLDRAEACRVIIDEHGEAVAVNGVIRANPLLRDELSNRAFVSKCLERLGVNQEVPKATGRPPETWNYEKTPQQTA